MLWGSSRPTRGGHSDYSRFIDASTVDLLKNPIRFQRDTFFKEYLEDADFRKKINDRVKTMADGNAVELRKYVKYDVTDLQYMLFGSARRQRVGQELQGSGSRVALSAGGRHRREGRPLADRGGRGRGPKSARCFRYP